MAPTASVIATLTEEPQEGVFDSLPHGVDWLELRADLIGDLDPAWLRQHFAGRLLYTLRSSAEGGGFEGDPLERRRRLAAAARSFDRVDLEMERDLEAPLLAEVASEQRVLSWHGRGPGVQGLLRRFESASTTPAALYKFVPAAAEARDELAPLELLRELGRSDVIAFASGESGVWTRFLAPYLGAPLLYGALGAGPGAPGQPSVERICRDYGFPHMVELSAISGIVGDPVGHSLSPRLHNGAYRALGIDALYLAFQPARFGDFWVEVVEGGLLEKIGCPLTSLSVTAPFKSLAAAVAGACSPLARRIDSANTLVRREGVWEAESTDPAGVVGAIEDRGGGISGRRVAVVGCGGAGRAAAAGLSGAGGEVTMVNRSVDSGRKVAVDLGLGFEPLAGFDPAPFEIVVNATSLGHRADDELPIDVERLAAGAAVVDLVYGEQPTALVNAVRDSGRLAVDGREVLLFQAVKQFRLMTGRDLPIALGRELLAIGEQEAA